MNSAMGAKIMDMEHTRGDTIEFYVLIEDFVGTVSTVRFSCRTDYDNSSYIFQKTLNNGITDMGNGLYKVRAAPADTANVTPGMYVYDVEFAIGSDVYTPLKGALHITPDVTHS